MAAASSASSPICPRPVARPPEHCHDSSSPIVWLAGWLAGCDCKLQLMLQRTELIPRRQGCGEDLCVQTTQPTWPTPVPPRLSAQSWTAIVSDLHLYVCRANLLPPSPQTATGRGSLHTRVRVETTRNRLICSIPPLLRRAYYGVHRYIPVFMYSSVVCTLSLPSNSR